MMIDINLEELNKFSDNYYKEINELEANINDIFDQLLSLDESINTPNITKRINEFNKLYYELKNTIKNNNVYIDTQVKKMINCYDNLYKEIKKEVKND